MSQSYADLPPGVVSRLREKYRHASKDLFDWLWSEFKSVVPDAVCNVTERYVAFYAYRRQLFAYVLPWRAGLLIAVAESVFERLRPQTLDRRPFYEWNSRPFVGTVLRSKNQEILDLLAGAYIERVAGLHEVQPIKTPLEKRIDRLVPKMEEDAGSRAYEDEQFEGRKRSRFSSYYERKPALRAKAVAIHGKTCMVLECGFSFEEVYGSHGEDYIEVHHLEPLSRLDSEEMQPDPATDMAVVCSNCHRMIHRNRERVLTLEQVSRLICRHRKSKVKGEDRKT